MPKLPFKLPNLGLDAEKALVFSVDRSKLPPLATYSMPTPWSNNEDVLEVMHYLYDPRSSDQPAPTITSEHACHLFSTAQPCVGLPSPNGLTRPQRSRCSGDGARPRRDYARHRHLGVEVAPGQPRHPRQAHRRAHVRMRTGFVDTR